MNNMGKDTTSGGGGGTDGSGTATGGTSGKEENAAHDPSQQSAIVHLLDSRNITFYVPKKADGSELFDKVVAYLSLNEKEYFALSFSDGDGNRHWLYEDKRISKQLKGHPWDFNFEVKFYPPEPTALNDDNTRHLLCLQVRHDISTGKLPATIPTYALLGSYVAQSVRGDYEPTVGYIDFLKSCHLCPVSPDTLYEKVEELHKQHRGVTPGEADLYYLDNAKKLSMYGVHLFAAKDGKGVPVQIGVSAHGINVYRDQIRINRFLWQNILKIAYRRNAFIVKVKPGELEKNESTAAFKMPDYDSAKRVWKGAVEHHTFFRLIQPEEKARKGLFRWGSAKFRYQGRTQFQSKMASQMFNNQPLQRSNSDRLERNDKIAVPKNQTLPLSCMKENARENVQWCQNQTSVPEKTYSMRITESLHQHGNNSLLDGAEVGNYSRNAHLVDSSRKLHDGKGYRAVNAAISTSTGASSVATAAANGQAFDEETPAQFSSFDFSRYAQNNALSTDKLSGSSVVHDQGQHVVDQGNLNRSNVNTQMENQHFVLKEDTAVVYHPGHYEEEAVHGYHNGTLREPPFEPGDDFVLVHRPKLGATGKIFHESGAETDILVKEEDIEAYPIRFLTDVYHSGYSKLNSGNNDFDVFEREKCSGTVDVVDKQKVNKKNYPKNEKFVGQVMRTERSVELPIEPLRLHAYVYNQGFYDVKNSQSDNADSKGNLRYWLRGYRKTTDIPAPSVRLAESRKRKEEHQYSTNGSKYIGSDKSDVHVVDKPDNTKKTALLYVKKPTGANVVAVNGNHTEEPDGAKLLRITDTTNSDEKMKTNRDTYAPAASRIGYEEVNTKLSRPGAYGFPSTSNEGPVHNMGKEEEMHALPIREHAAVYHSGISFGKDKRKKFGGKKETQEGSFSGEASDDELSDVGQKRAAVIHVLESKKGNSKFSDNANFGSVTEGKDYSGERLHGENFVKLNKRNVETEVSHDKDISRKGRATLYINSQIGSVDENNKMKSNANLSVEGSKEAASVNTKYGVRTASKSSSVFGKISSNILPDKPSTEFIYDNTPPLEPLARTDEIAFHPLHLTVNVANYQVRGLPHNYDYKTFKRAKYDGNVEFVAKENVNPESYKLECTAYKGPLDSTLLVKELKFSPIQEHATIYHPGYSYTKSRSARKRKKATKFLENYDSEVSNSKSTALLHLKSSQDERTDGDLLKDNKNFKWQMDDQSRNLDGHPGYKAKGVSKIPEKTGIPVVRSGKGNRLFKYRAHAGDVEIVEKSHIKLDLYKLVETPYVGPLDRLECSNELTFSQLKDYSNAYHPGISYTRKRRTRGNTSESSTVSTGSSSSDSTSISDSTSDKFSEPKKKAILYMKTNDKLPKDADSAGTKREDGFFSFWHRTNQNEENHGPHDVKKSKPDSLFRKSKPETPPKPKLDAEKNDLSGCSLSTPKITTYSEGISTTSLKGSNYDYKGERHHEDQNRMISATIHVKGGETNALESAESDIKTGRFDPFTYWRSTGDAKKSTENTLDVSYSVNIHETSEVSLSSDGKVNSSNSANEMKSVVFVNKENEFSGTLSPSEAMKEEPVRSFMNDESNELKTKPMSKKMKASLYLRGSPRADGNQSVNVTNTSDVSHTGVTSENAALQTSENIDFIEQTSPMVEVPYQPLRAKISIQQDSSVMQSKFDNGNALGNIEISNTDREDKDRVVSAMKGERNKNYANQESKPTKKILPSETGSSSPSSFKLKGVHLRGPPSDFDNAVHLGTTKSSKPQSFEVETQNSNIEYAAEGNAKSRDSEDREFPADGSKSGKKVATLRIRDEQLIESSGSSAKEAKKESNKSAGSGFFSFLRGNKLKNSDVQQKQKVKDEDRGVETTALEITSPADELQYKTLRAKIDVYGTGSKKDNFTSESDDVDKKSERFVPVYDFSYVPVFQTSVSDAAFPNSVNGANTVEGNTSLRLKSDLSDDKKSIDSEEITAKTGESKTWSLRRLFGHKVKEGNEFEAAVSPSENEAIKGEQHDSNSEFHRVALSDEKLASELSWSKFGPSKIDQSTDSSKEKSVEIEDRLLSNQEANSVEASDEPYQFTQTPPDDSVSMVRTTETKSPRGFVEQIKRHVTQVVSKSSASSESKKKQKERKRSKKDVSSRGSRCSSTSETESASRHDSSHLDSKNTVDKFADVTDTLSYEKSELDGGSSVSMVRNADNALHLDQADDGPATDSEKMTNESHKTIESWHGTRTPEAVVTNVDQHGNVVRRTIKTQQVKHTIQRQTYQTYGVSGRNGDPGLHIVETTQKSITPIGDGAVTSAQSPVVETRSHSLAYESLKGGSGIANGDTYSDVPGELISSRTITQGNRTIETITYKTEKNGIVETHVEHRVTIQSGENIDHDAELSQAILEATNMNPDMTVEKIEVKQESQS